MTADTGSTRTRQQQVLTCRKQRQQRLAVRSVCGFYLSAVMLHSEMSIASWQRGQQRSPSKLYVQYKSTYA
eukprot:6172636-Pleurochrysis_carterae.AAC.1